ncbi:MAG: flagellin [Phyllobacterium sp.]
MSSILTNASAMTALQTLSATNKNLASTQNRIATGMKVAEASDNAAYWSIATTMRSDNKANGVITSSLGLGGAKVDTAYTAIKDAVTAVDTIKEKVLSAKNASAEDRAKIQIEIKTLQDQLKESAKASYAGSNLLTTDSGDDATAPNFSIVSSYNRATDGTVSTGSIDVALENIRLVDTGGAAPADKLGILDAEFDVTGAAVTDATAGKMSILNIDVSAATNDMLDQMLAGVETAAGALATGASALGAAKTRIEMQTTFISNISDAIERGVGAMVDADMNKESARLSALQVQQQLGVQALSIANSGNQNILSLFRG